MSIRTLFAFAVCLAVAVPTEAGGFLIDQQSAESSARANAVVASPQNASTIFYNPAGLAKLDGLQLYGGLALVRPRAKFVQDEPYVVQGAEAQNFFLPTVYGAYRINERLAVGMGIYAPFGLGIRWDAQSLARTVVREQILRTVFFSPVVAADLTPWVSGLRVGGGIDLVPASVYLRRDVPFGQSVGVAEVGGTAFGVGARVGVLWEAPMVKGLSAGLTYKSPVSLSFSGNANFTADATFAGELPPDGAASTKLTLPQSITGGVAYQVMNIVLLEADVNFVGWSSFKELTLNLPGDTEQTTAKNWNNTVGVRLGATGDIGPVSVRGGYAYDPSPVPSSTLDFTLPDTNRHVLSLGAGAKLPKGFFVDGSLTYVLPGQAKTSSDARFAGSFETNALVVSLNVGAALDL